MNKSFTSLTAIPVAILMLLILSSCAKEETKTSIMYYDLLDASGNQVNVSVNVAPESTKAK